MTITDSYILGVDTALGQTSLALRAGESILAQAHYAERSQQAAQLVPWIEALLRNAKTDYARLSGIACAVGPGGFTAIRIGLATARGIAYAAELPVVGYSTLQIMAYGARESGKPCVAVLPAGRGYLFVQRFAEEGVISGEPDMIARDTLPEWLEESDVVVSTLSDLEGMTCRMHDVAQNAVLLTQMAASDIPSLPAAPLYIKPPDATPGIPLIERLQALD